MLTSVIIVVVIFLVVGIIFAIILGLCSKYFKVKEDPRKDEVMSMMPGVNCGACGHPGCAGLVDALLDGSENKVTNCKVIKKENAQKVVDYLNSTKAPEGCKDIHVSL